MKLLKVAAILLLILLLAACQNGSEQSIDEEQQTDNEIVSDEDAPGEDAPGEDAPGESVPDEGGSNGDASDSSETAAEPTSVPQLDIPTPQPPGDPEEVTIEAADGLAIHGTFYPGSGAGPWPAVILLHMNGGNRSDWDPFAQQLADNGHAALTVDMRGHGDTGDQKEWDQTADDLQRVWAYMTGREGVDASRTAVAGASIGANMSLVTAVNQPEITTAILLSPGLNYFGVTTDDRIVEYGERPILIVASEEDSLAADSSRALDELATNSELIMYNGAGHGTRMFGPQPDLSGRMLAWFDEHLKGESQAATGDGSSSSLFNVAWDDRSLYRSGVISEEAAVLDQMPGASVYHIDMAISPDLQMVAGALAVRYTNQEDVNLDEIYLHLHPNLLGGSVAISDLTLNGETVDPEYISNEITRDSADSSTLPQTEAVNTVMRVPLPTSLASGERAVMAMEFLVEVPTEAGSNYGVFASIDDVLALAHFYPQIAVYDDEGWNIDVPPPNADVTYGDSSFYLARVTAPAEQVILTSGSEIDKQTDGDDQVITVAAGPVRDFYIASSDRYTIISDTVGETTVNSYGFPEFAEQNEQVLGIATTALDSLGDRLGPYPFTEFDIAPTPNQALGVEYPGAVVIRSALYDSEATLGGTPSLYYTEATVAHEAGHQWFYSTVGNDQLDEPWLDEALTQYATMLYFLDSYGPQGAEGYHDSFVGRWDRVDQADIPIGLPAGDYSSSEYGAIVYGRGPLFFEALAEEMGQDTFDAFLRDYYQQNKWGIATGEGMKALAETACDCDLSPIFAEWVGEL